MHDLDRTQVDPHPRHMRGGVLGGGAAWARGPHEADELELAPRFLEIQSEDELEQFVGNGLSSAVEGANALVDSPAGRALTGILHDTAKDALGVIGSRGAPGAAAAARDAAVSTASRLLGSELESLSPEDREFHLARGFTRFGRDAWSNLVRTHYHQAPQWGPYGGNLGRAPRSHGDDWAAARNAAMLAARRYMPGLLGGFERGYGRHRGSPWGWTYRPREWVYPRETWRAREPFADWAQPGVSPFVQAPPVVLAPSAVPPPMFGPDLSAPPRFPDQPPPPVGAVPDSVSAPPADTTSVPPVDPSSTPPPSIPTDTAAPFGAAPDSGPPPVVPPGGSPELEYMMGHGPVLSQGLGIHPPHHHHHRHHHRHRRPPGGAWGYGGPGSAGGPWSYGGGPMDDQFDQDDGGDDQMYGNGYEYEGELEGVLGEITADSRHNGAQSSHTVAPSLSPEQTTALAHQLLQTESEDELEQFLGDLLKGAANALGGIIKGPVAGALGGALKNVVKAALPAVGSGIGSFILPGAGTAIGGQLGSLASSLFEYEGELESMPPDQRELETAQRLVEFTVGAGQQAAHHHHHHPGMSDRAIVNDALRASAQRYAPGLLEPVAMDVQLEPGAHADGGAFDPPWYGDDEGDEPYGVETREEPYGLGHHRRHGRWIRRGRDIIVRGV